jgi:hypothetical protein
MAESKTKLEYIKQELLDFDPTNPRFGEQMRSNSPDAIQHALMKEPYYASELIESLLKNGFIDYEPLVVKRKGKRFTIVEGNRRLAAIREILMHLDKYHGQIEDLREIPALVFPNQPDTEQKNEMRVYLGVRHLLGFREWPPLSKARFLDRESKEEGGLDKVLLETRLTRTQARRFLLPYRLLHNADEKLPEGEDFWVLAEALGRAGIKNFLRLEVDPDNLAIINYDKKRLSLLLNYLYGSKKTTGERESGQKVVADTRDLSRLGKVLSSEKATAILKTGKSLEQAEIFVDTREESLKRLTKVVKDMGALLKKLTSGSKNTETSHMTQAYKNFESAVKAFVNMEER